MRLCGMSMPSAARGRIALRFQVLFPHLNERQRRLLVAAEARLVGHGGVRAVAQAAGVSETTVRKGVFELERAEHPLPDGRVRRPGGGRTRAEDLDTGLVPALLRLVEPDERGDPMSPLRWTTKSLRHLAAQLARQGHRVSAPTVGRLLRANGFSLQANVKTLEGRQHPDRDEQFRYINDQVTQYQVAGDPVISVDAKKKEQLGLLPAAGREWRPMGEPVQVEDHSFFFSGSDTDHAIPYGVYDVTANTGMVNVGVDHDTSAFAVASIRRWWQARGRHDYPQARRLLITADAGGSNSHRFRLWKAELADFATDAGLEITVCHFPPGTSKWNKIEHRLFSHITMNWRGRPLTSHHVVVNTIAATRTTTGLQVQAELDTGAYPTGVSVSKQRMDALPIRPHRHRGAWNYTITPALSHDRQHSPPASQAKLRAEALQTLAHPILTGMPRRQLDALAARLAPLQAAQDEQRCYEQRGGRRINAPGAGGRPLLSPADRLLITVVYLRQACTQRVLSDMLEINPNSISKAIAETTRLLDRQRHTITATTLRCTTVQALTDYLTGDNSTTLQPDPPHTLSHPCLTGMSRAEFADLIQRLALPYAAQTERLRHRRRGRDRLPGTRGGVFRRKITQAERILATVLYQRGLCTRDVLAQLFDVSPRTIGNAFTEVLPLLQQDNWTPAPGARRFATAAALLASVTPSDTPTR
jgi:hypothetical protein